MTQLPSGQNDDPATQPTEVAPGPIAAELQPVAEAAGGEPRWRRYDLRDAEAIALDDALAAVMAGECIVLPTDTVYGIGANAFDAAAVQRLLNAKHRGREMPPPVLIAEPAMLAALAAKVPQAARDLAKAFWPGPLTLILAAPSSLRMDLGESRGTIALRVPDHEATRRLLRRTGPLAVSSANVSGGPSSTSIGDAIEQLGDEVAVYLDAGPTPGETPSSIVDFSSTVDGRLLRKGVLSIDQIRMIAPQCEDLPADLASTPKGDAAAMARADTSHETTVEFADGAADGIGDGSDVGPVTDGTDAGPVNPDPDAASAPDDAAFGPVVD